ncbi:MAG: glycine oxidase ThiO [Thermoleophilaceae bacterium]|nr:glycine oxidase ThiO [Thermoleophilaceae bacterium]
MREEEHALEQSRDVIVVGAGIIGLACAHRLAADGRDVLCLERGEPGGASSRAAAGMLAPVTEAEFGEEALYELNIAAAERWPEFAQEIGAAAAGYRREGALMVAGDRDDAEALQRVRGLRERLGIASAWLTGKECRELEPGLSPRVPGGLLAPEDGQVDPRAVCAALVRALGDRVRGGAEVRHLDRRSVTLAGGEIIRAERIVVAAGAWSGDLAPVSVRPVKGQILRLRGPTVCQRIVRTPRCYVVPREDGRVVIGATVEDKGFDTRVTAEGVFRLLEAAREVLPDVDELELEEASAALRPGTPDNAPVVGEVEGLLVATGHYRNGILHAPIAADAVAALVAQRDWVGTG